MGELASSSIDTWRLLLLGRVRSKTRVLVWGHVNNYVNDESWLGRKTKRLMARMSDGVLAYTADGAATARAWLGGGKEVTVLNNSRATPTFPDQSDGEHKPRLIFIGGLDRSKRLDELILVGQALASRVADFELVVIGDGPDRSYIQAAAANYAWLKYVGRKAGDEKWAMIASAAGILMPGRVGLVVIDSFASQVPIVTQTWRYHAPEFSYLVHEANALIGDGPGSLTEQAHRLLTEPGLRDRLAAGCRASREIYSLDQMVQNFVDAVVHAAARGGHYPTRRPESYSVD